LAEAPAPTAFGKPARTAAGSTRNAAVASADKSETVTVRTDLFVAEIAKQGGDLVRLEFNAYKDSKNKPRTLPSSRPSTSILPRVV
jgi:YidC/Oxa1 family membrane protein insertase